MGSYDMSNGEELKPGKVYDYDLRQQQYDIKENQISNTYDQFIMLRDTLVYSKKYYKGKAGSVLVIGDTEETVEIIYRNRFIQKLNSNRETDPDAIKTTIQGPYVTQDGIDTSVYGYASCRITKSGYYKVTHKEELINIPAGTTRIRAYIERIPMNSQGGNGQPGTGTPIALYDDQSNAYSFDQLYTRRTIIGTVDTNLEEGDLLMLRIVDQNGNTLPLETYWSNRWTVDYINLPLNEI